MYVFFYKKKTAYEMRISDWSSDVCSSDLTGQPQQQAEHAGLAEDLEHDLVRVERRARAPGRDFLRLRIAGRERIAEVARTDAVDRVPARHAQRGAPTPAAAGQRGAQPRPAGGPARKGQVWGKRVSGR